jgi:hypothetical protein
MHARHLIGKYGMGLVNVKPWQRCLVRNEMGINAKVLTYGKAKQTVQGLEMCHQNGV